MFRRKHKSHEHQEHDAVQKDKIVKELRTAIQPLSGRNLKYCTDACLRRYLEARNWNLDKSKKMLEETLKWRSSYKPEEIRWHEVAMEGETGKAYTADFLDQEGRTVLVMKPGKQNTASHDSQLKHLVYLLENAIMNLPEGQEQMVWLIDFTGWSLSNSVPMKIARETANILQNHYPERLATGYLCNPPRIFETFWKVVKYFLDPKTHQKVNFVYADHDESKEFMRRHFDLDILPKEFGGRRSTQYDHEDFSKLMRKYDIKTASYWDLNEKPTKLNHVKHGHTVPEPEPSKVAAHAT